MCTSTDDCFCHEQVRQSRSPNSAADQRITSSADMASRSGSGLRLGVAKQHLPQRVAAEAEPERLERDDLVGRDVAEVHRRPRTGVMNHACEDFDGASKIRAPASIECDDLVDEPGSHLAASGR